MLGTLFPLSQQFLSLKNQPYRRYFIRRTDLSHRMNILIGARGIGKTTTLIQSLLDYVSQEIHSPKILYLQADHFLMKNLSLYEIAEAFIQHGGEYLAIDEIHKYPDWSMELKSIFDTFETLKILASGSSALEISKGSHDLSRRALLYRMQGLSFREYLEMTYSLSLEAFSLSNLWREHETRAKNIISSLKDKKLKVLSVFKDYLQEGYYPYRPELASRDHYKMILEQNVHVTLESDLVAIYPELSGRSIGKIKKLLSFIADQVPFTPNWTKIAGVLDLGDTRTVKQYFQYLESAELILSFGSQSKKFKGLENPEKVFLNNTNLMYALVSNTPEIGTIRETFFSNMLICDYELTLPNKGDFQIDQEAVVEIGGAKKGFAQLSEVENGWVAADDIECGFKRKVPLWLFGFLY